MLRILWDATLKSSWQKPTIRYMRAAIKPLYSTQAVASLQWLYFRCNRQPSYIKQLELAREHNIFTCTFMTTVKIKLEMLEVGL